MWSRSWRSVEIARRGSASPASLDVLLELVDLVVQVVDQVEVALGDLVDEAEEVHADGLVRAGTRPSAALGSNELLVRRRLRDRERAGRA